MGIKLKMLDEKLTGDGFVQQTDNIGGWTGTYVKDGYRVIYERDGTFVFIGTPFRVIVQMPSSMLDSRMVDRVLSYIRRGLR